MFWTCAFPKIHPRAMKNKIMIIIIGTTLIVKNNCEIRVSTVLVFLSFGFVWIQYAKQHMYEHPLYFIPGILYANFI